VEAVYQRRRSSEVYQTKEKPETVTGKVTVTSFINGWCPAMNIVHERAKRASGELSDRVEYQIIPTEKKETIREWGISDALFIDGKSIRMSPPPSYDKIRRKISKREGKT